MNSVIKTLCFLLVCAIAEKPGPAKAQNHSNSSKSEAARSSKSTRLSIDGTYELVKRVMADGTISQPPAIKALYDLHNGRLNFNLFIRKKDGTMSSESTVGHYTFTHNQYCEWIDYTIRSNLDSAGVTYNGPVVTNHCAPVKWSKDGFSYSPPGESVDVIFRPDGFTAKIAGEFVDYWRKVR